MGRGRHEIGDEAGTSYIVMQYIEDLSDRQAADAVRSRIDWKYALSLDLHDPGFDFTLLHDFRDRLLAQDAAQRLLDEGVDGRVTTGEGKPIAGAQ